MQQIRVIGIGCALVACALVGGCKRGPSLDGSWNAGDAGTFTFASNTFKMEGQIPNAGTATLSGTYALDKDQLTLTPTDFSVKGSSPAAQAMLDQQVGKSKSMIMKTVTDENPMKLTWKDNDHITITSKTGQAKDLNRIPAK